ncbi:MAG: hypothetical protein HY282_18350 [Nitrospirae bacterium]|nr:hypothetical protein [Candidatus Manganitrophaceae bacterium]
MKKIALLGGLLFLFVWLAGVATAALPTGFGKARWGMTEQELLAAYDIQLSPPKRMDDTGPWAIEGPAPGELTVSGTAFGEPNVRSISLGFHPEWGLTIIHVRFRDANKPGEIETLLPKWTGSYGKPKEQLPGPKVIWEDNVTHIEMTYHTVSPRHPTPSDHVALVLWNIPLMDKITASEAPPRPPDVETLAPVEGHQKPK